MKIVARIVRRIVKIDEAKCNGCGVCEPGCPVQTPSEFDVGLGKRKAIYIPFPQAVPKKYTIDKREERLCQAACKEACPIDTNVLGYIKLIGEGEFEAAYELIRDTNPLPAVCGRVCPAPCEEAAAATCWTRCPRCERNALFVFVGIQEDGEGQQLDLWMCGACGSTVSGTEIRVQESDT